jgi:hypothetical protein
MRRLLPIVVLAGCNSFENPEVVLDFRVLAIKAEPPEQAIDIDIEQPEPPATLLDQLVPAQLCVLLSDRNFERRIRWEMRVCVLDDDERCDPDSPSYVIGSGLWDDPELAAADPQNCATIQPDSNLLGVALYSFQTDQLRGLGGLYYGVSLRVGGEDADPSLDLYAAKNLRLMPRIPATVEANHNPTIASLEATVLPDGAPTPLPFGRCRDQAAPLEMAPDTQVRILPIEPDGVREPYVAPTIDGMGRMFTESLTYQWLATAGNFSESTSGGPRDAFGNPATLFSDWRSPKAGDLDGPTDVDLWIVQRDERLGVAWFESCIRVLP